MKLWVLGSGSRGNAVLIESGESRVLVDAGFARARSAAAAHHRRGARVDRGVHRHARAHGSREGRGGRRAALGVDAVRERGNGRRVAGAAGRRTASACRLERRIDLSRVRVTTYATPHDAASPIGVRVTVDAERRECGGVHRPRTRERRVRALCSDADLLVLESNHDEGMLRAGPYPPQRAGAHRVAHGASLAIGRARGSSRDVVQANLAHVVLAHLSENCNDHGVAHTTTADALRRTRFRGRLQRGDAARCGRPVRAAGIEGRGGSAVRARAVEKRERGPRGPRSSLPSMRSSG